jgi:hypothetical protein
VWRVSCVAAAAVSGLPAADLHGSGSSGLPPLPRDERERYRPQHGDQQMPVAERPVDDRDQAKQREECVAQVPAIHSTILAIPLSGMITMSRSTGAPAICRSPLASGGSAPGEGEAVGDPADVRALRPYHTWYRNNFSRAPVTWPVGGGGQAPTNRCSRRSRWFRLRPTPASAWRRPPAAVRTYVHTSTTRGWLRLERRFIATRVVRC